MKDITVYVEFLTRSEKVFSYYYDIENDDRGGLHSMTRGHIIYRRQKQKLKTLTDSGRKLRVLSFVGISMNFKVQKG